MRRNTRTWPVFSVNTRKSRIDPSPPYQRGLVWSRPQKQLFIDSLIRDFDIPKLYLRRTTDTDSQYEWEVVDGQQRLKAIWEFIGNEFPVSRDADPVGGHEIGGKRFNDLHDDVQEQLQGYELNIVELEESEDQEIQEMFIRLQNGVPLNAAEKRNAISGPVRDFVSNIASSHDLITNSIEFQNRRYAHDEIVAQMLFIEMNGGLAHITPTKLRDMYEDSDGFSPNSKCARKFRKVLNFLAQAFPNRHPELTKTNSLSLYIVASEALDRYSLSNRAKGFTKWFVEFEKRRIANQDLPEDEMDPEMREYQTAILQGTLSLTSQNVRRDFLMKDLLANMPSLRALDSQRQFTHEQRQVIYRKANGKCVNPNENPDCVEDCTWDNFHADHITPFSAGGKTSVENGQLLCPSCNLKKSDTQ